MKCPKEKAVGYTAAVAGCAIGVMIVLSLIGRIFVPSGMAAFGRAGAASGGEVQFDKDSPLGKLADLGKAMEAGNKKMEAAQRSGDTNAQTAAAMEQLGTLMGGGKRVDPVAIDQLKPLIPTTFAGLAKLSSNAERAGVAAMMVSKASARYGDRAQKSVSLDISDAGGATGLLGLAAWANVQGEREDDNGFERTQRVDGRLVHEKGSKRPGGSDELTVIVADRFVVSARGTRRRARRAQDRDGQPGSGQAGSAQERRRPELSGTRDERIPGGVRPRAEAVRFRIQARTAGACSDSRDLTAQGIRSPARTRTAEPDPERPRARPRPGSRAPRTTVSRRE